MSELKSALPDTTQGAFKLGQECHQLGKSIDYNPYRNMESRFNHLWAAWNRGWKSQDLPESPDQPSVNN